MLTASDHFCGLGGQTRAAQLAGGIEVVQAANHWDIACTVYQDNNLEVEVECADLQRAHPARYRPTDLLIAGPECTNHSNAKGAQRRKQNTSLFGDFDPKAEKSRMTMWEVVRFAEQHQYKGILIENVVEAAAWPLWHVWLDAMTTLGYRYHVFSLNSMHFGVPQSRDRIYVLFWLGDLDINRDIELPAYCWRCERMVVARQAWKNGRTVGRYRQQYIFACTTCGKEATPPTVPAINALDLSIPTEAIKDRKRPLKPATIRRAKMGYELFGINPYVFVGAGNTFQREGSTCRSRSLLEPMFTQATTLQHYVVQPPIPVMIRGNGGNCAPEHNGSSSMEPAPTQTTAWNQAVVVPPGWLVQPAHSGDDRSRVRGGVEPAFTVAASDDRPMLVVPPGAAMAGGHEGITARGAQAVIIPLTRNSRPRHADLQPSNAQRAEGNTSGVLIPYYGGSEGTDSVHVATHPSGAQRTHEGHGIITWDGEVPAFEDCGYRTVRPPEVGNLMALEDHDLSSAPNAKDQVRLYGNAVTPPAPAVPLRRLVDALGG